MYNEVDYLILDSIARCSYCDSRNIKRCGSTTTLAAGFDTAEDSFNNHCAMHDHDFNQMTASYECWDCERVFHIIPLNACWCGWVQICTRDHKGYHFIG
jgi:hypothetical protein